MSRNDEFVVVNLHPDQPSICDAFNDNATGKRVYTEALVAKLLRDKYPHHHLTITPALEFNLLGYAQARDDASYRIHGEPTHALMERLFIAPDRRRTDTEGGSFSVAIKFAAYDYVFRGDQFVIYMVEGGDGMISKTMRIYILVDPCLSGSTSVEVSSEAWLERAQSLSDELIAVVSEWTLETHDEILVFDGGQWQKNRQLWENVQNAEWADVILDDAKKRAIIDDVASFFDGEKRYGEYGVPWKVWISSPTRDVAC